MKLALLYLLVITSFILSSCKKKINTTANIYVRDETQALVNNAMVILYGENTTGLPNQISVYDTAYTNTQGLATFDYNYLKVRLSLVLTSTYIQFVQIRLPFLPSRHLLMSFFVRLHLD